MAGPSVTQTTPVSVVMITRNEATNMTACLESLKDFEEIIVVDNGSSDATIDIASTFPNVRVLKSEWKGYGATRQLGVDAARHNWILWMDADERMTPALREEILVTLAHSPTNSILSIPRRNFFVGKEIHGCGWSPDRVLRVFNRENTSFDDKKVHEGLHSKSQRDVVRLNQALIHFSYVSIQQFFEKNNRYALLAADERIRLGRKVYIPEVILRPLWEFFRAYILKLGFRDGLRGLIISLGSAIYVLIRDATCLLRNS